MYHPVTIFALDDTTDYGEFGLYAHASYAGFPRPQPCTGSYKGVQEQSFIMAREDFDKFMRSGMGQALIKDQESVLHVTGCNKAYAVLEYLGDGRIESLGSMVEVTEEVAKQHDAWTHRLGRWYITEHMNPDHHKRLVPDQPTPKYRYFIKAGGAEHYFGYDTFMGLETFYLSKGEATAFTNPLTPTQMAKWTTHLPVYMETV